VSRTRLVRRAALDGGVEGKRVRKTVTRDRGPQSGANEPSGKVDGTRFAVSLGCAARPLGSEAHVRVGLPEPEVLLALQGVEGRCWQGDSRS
jgi:hypothetical protein